MNRRHARAVILFSRAAVILSIGEAALFAQTNASPNLENGLAQTNATTQTEPLASYGATGALATLVSNPLSTLIARISTAATNDAVAVQTNLQPPIDPLTEKLEMARYLRKSRQTKELEPLLVSLLDKSVPESIQKAALLELGGVAQDRDDLPRAQQIYAQFLNRWPDDAQVPEVLLRQGQIFRQMGLHNLALTKFYAVMTAALTLKSDRLDYYEHLVVESQIEIAETHYSIGAYGDAAEYFSRLFQEDNPEIDKPQILYRLVICYDNTTNYDKAVASGREFLSHYPNAPQEPEVRFYLATALKELGRDNESLQEVLTLLQEERAHALDKPEVWAYWRQRAGNLVANQFYREGDYPRALDIYTSLAELDGSPDWQLPVWYQIGMTYEHLLQPQKATEFYNRIINADAELGTNAAPSLSSIADMARWRVGFIQWEGDAESANRFFTETNTAFTATTAKPTSSHE